ncbi:MAG: hypothetical protein J4F28_07540 [Nitrosopumilaceae archaeon]|nr:hypothetical protein [Nitrosopumilaceae archaeon]
MDRETILEWLNHSGLEYDVFDDLPPTYEYGVVIKRSTVVVFWHKNDDVIELQSTPVFNDEITKSFFGMNDTSRNNVSCKLREKILNLDIRHNIVAVEKENLFGFTLRIYLPKTLSKIDLLNAHGKITEIRDVVGQYIAPIIEGERAL